MSPLAWRAHLWLHPWGPFNQEPPKSRKFWLKTQVAFINCSRFWLPRKEWVLSRSRTVWSLLWVSGWGSGSQTLSWWPPIWRWQSQSRKMVLLFTYLHTLFSLVKFDIYLNLSIFSDYPFNVECGSREYVRKLF